jgi:hypothetical protein
MQCATSYEKRQTIREVEEIFQGGLRIEESIQVSMDRIYDRLKRSVKAHGKIDDVLAVLELSLLNRGGLISNLYLCCSPVADKSEELKREKEKTEENLSQFQRDLIDKTHRDYLKTLENGEICKYV